MAKRSFLAAYNPDIDYLDTVKRSCPPMPEVDMWLTCIAQGIFSACSGDEKDLRWIRSDSERPGHSLRWLCIHLGIDRDHLVEMVEAAIAGQRELMTSYHVVKHFTDRHWTADRKGKGQRTPKLRQRLRFGRKH